MNKGLSWTSSQGSAMNNGSQQNEESGVSIEEGVFAEQRVRGLKWTRVSAEQGVKCL